MFLRQGRCSSLLDLASLLVARLGFAAALLLILAAGASAQTPPGVPPPISPLERAIPPTAPIPAPPLLPTPIPALPEAQGGATVTVQAVELDGVTVYRPDQLAPLYQGIVGQSVPLGRVSTVLQEIQTKYRNDGYFLTVVRGAIEPVNGKPTLRIRVVEGFISDVKIDGDVGPVGVLVYDFLNKLTAIRPVNISDVERALLLAQDVPGISVRGVLRPGTGEPGAVELVAQVGRKDFDGFFQYDNRAPPFAGPSEMLLVGNANSFTSLGERTQLSVYDTPFNEQSIFGQFAEEAFLGSSGLKGRVYAGYGPSYPTGALALVGYQSFLTVAGASLSYPVIRTRPLSLSLSFAFDLSNADINSLLTGTEQRTTTENVRTLSVAAAGNSTDETAGLGLIGANNLSLNLYQGLPGLGSQIINDRPGAIDNFLKLVGQVTRVQNLFTVFGDQVALELSVGGQYSGDILPSISEYFLGGAQYGRGFYSGQIIGDKALGTTVELQYNTAVQWPMPIGLQPYFFWDNGLAYSNEPNTHNQRLESAGLGVRFAITQHVSIDAEGVRRYTLQPNGSSVAPLTPYAGFVTLALRF